MKCINIPVELVNLIMSIEEKLENKNINLDNNFEKLFDEFHNIINLIQNKKVKRQWLQYYDKICLFGIKNAPCNILIDNTTNKNKLCLFPFQSELNITKNETNKFVNNIIKSGYQIAINSGPLMEEPMSGVCFIIEELDFHQLESNIHLLNDLNFKNKLIKLTMECCRISYLASGRVRLSLPMYETTIYLNSNIMGKAYAVLSKREAKILKEEIMPETNLFMIVAQMPVIESFGFVAEILTKCRGLAQPQMSFSHWQVILLS